MDNCSVVRDDDVDEEHHNFVPTLTSDVVEAGPSPLTSRVRKLVQPTLASLIQATSMTYTSDDVPKSNAKKWVNSLLKYFDLVSERENAKGKPVVTMRCKLCNDAGGSKISLSDKGSYTFRRHLEASLSS